MFAAAAAKRTALAAATVAALVAMSLVGAAGGAPGDTSDRVAPSAPTNLHVTSATSSRVSTAWDPAQDDTGVVGYYVYLDEEAGRKRVTKPAYTVPSLRCGETTGIGVSAFDRSGNQSSRVYATISTAACPDSQAPSTPAGFVQLATTRDAVVLGWHASTDDVGVVGYGVYKGLARIASTVDPNVTLSGLACGTTTPYQVDAVDAAGNRSPLGTAYVQAAACGTAPAPSPEPAPTPQPSPTPSPTPAPSPEPAPTPPAPDDATWTFCSHEHERCSFTGSKQVRYGANGTFTEPRTFVDGVDCTNAVFGDPIRGVQKRCEVLATGPTEWSFCSAEHQRCSFTGSEDVRYGANDTFTEPRTFVDGVDCTNAVFGDPIRGVQKRCEVRTGGSAPPPSTPPPPSPTPPPPPSDASAPTAPTNLSVTSSAQTGVGLGWSPSSDNVGVTGYRAYVNGAGGPTSTGTSVTVTDLRCGVAYSFEVDAVDAAGNRSLRAGVTGSTAVCTDTQAPTAPTNVVATSRTATSIALGWNTSSDNVAVAGYGLYRGGSRIATSATTSGIFSGLTCNTNYTLAVDAVDAAGNRSSQTTVLVSTTACPDTTAPSAPTGLAASSVSQGGLTLTWNASTDNVGVTAYDVYRDGQKVASQSSRTLSQTGLACGTSYAFAVEALDAAGNRSARATLSASTSACSTAPAEWTFCANEHQRCTFTGSREVRYGVNGTFTAPRTFVDGVECANGVFGDPVPGVPKFCEVRSSGTAEVAPLPPPPSTPPPPPPGTSSPPITITAGGTYTGNWESTGSGAAITIATSQPVTIVNSVVKNLAGGPLINARGAVQVVVQNTRAYGGASAQTSGRFFVAESFKSVTIRNCSIENTRGIELWPTSVSGASVLITRNRHHNVQGSGTSPVGNFIQFRSVTSSAIEVSWNEVINDYNRSDPEDLISLYQSANANIHDNYFVGQSKPGNAYASSSQNGVTIESGTVPGSASNNVISNNQLVAGYAIGMFSGNNNVFRDNRIVRSGFLTDGVTMNRNGYEGIWIGTNGSNNRATGNVIGYVNRDGVRSDGRFPGAPGGDGAEWANNTHMPGTVTLAVERNEWTLWQQKLGANGITVGA